MKSAVFRGSSDRAFGVLCVVSDPITLWLRVLCL